MTLFEQMWRKNATPMLNHQFGESEQATYYDGTETEQGTYDVVLGPEELVEADEERGRKTHYKRVATLSWTDSSPFTEPTIATTGRLVIDSVTYSIAGVLSRSPSAAVLILRRTGSQRRGAE